MTKSPTIRGFTLVEVMICVLIIGIILAVALPNMLAARTRSQATSCIANLKQIENAKYQWAIINRKGAADTPTSTQLVGSAVDGYLRSFPTCPAAGTYVIGNMATRPTCSKASLGHAIPE